MTAGGPSIVLEGVRRDSIVEELNRADDRGEATSVVSTLRRVPFLDVDADDCNPSLAPKSRVRAVISVVLLVRGI